MLWRLQSFSSATERRFTGNFIVKALTICNRTKYKFVLSTNDNEQLFALCSSTNLGKPVDFAAIFH